MNVSTPRGTIRRGLNQVPLSVLYTRQFDARGVNLRCFLRFCMRKDHSRSTSKSTARRAPRETNLRAKCTFRRTVPSKSVATFGVSRKSDAFQVRHPSAFTSEIRSQRAVLSRGLRDLTVPSIDFCKSKKIIFV